MADVRSKFLSLKKKMQAELQNETAKAEREVLKKYNVPEREGGLFLFGYISNKKYASLSPEEAREVHRKKSDAIVDLDKKIMKARAKVTNKYEKEMDALFNKNTFLGMPKSGKLHEEMQQFIQDMTSADDTYTSEWQNAAGQDTNTIPEYEAGTIPEIAKTHLLKQSPETYKKLYGPTPTPTATPTPAPTPPPVSNPALEGLKKKLMQ